MRMSVLGVRRILRGKTTIGMTSEMIGKLEIK